MDMAERSLLILKKKRDEERRRNLRQIKRDRLDRLSPKELKRYRSILNGNRGPDGHTGWAPSERWWHEDDKNEGW